MDRGQTNTSGGSEDTNKSYMQQQPKSVATNSYFKGNMKRSATTLVHSSNGERTTENIELLVTDSTVPPTVDCGGLFFKDGLRKIDFVLVYCEGNDKEEEDRRSAFRKVYQENLAKQHGLELEEDISIKVANLR